MNRNSRRSQVQDHLRDQLERTGSIGTFQQIGEAVGMSAVGAWKHVQAMIADGVLIKARDGTISFAHQATNLKTIPTRALRGELARRGVTLDALEEPKLLPNEGRPCAANFCSNRVQRGRLFCRHHWFQLPSHMRSAILNAWGARQMQAYSEALEAARDYLGGFARVVERVE